MDETTSLLMDALTFLLTAAGDGFVVFKAMEELKKLWPADWKPLNGDQKFYTAIALAVLLPLAAYFAKAALLNMPISWEGVFAAFAVGYMTSQGIFRQSEKDAEAATGGGAQ